MEAVVVMTKVEAEQVYVKADRFGGAGSYAAVPIRKAFWVQGAGV